MKHIIAAVLMLLALNAGAAEKIGVYGGSCDYKIVVSSGCPPELIVAVSSSNVIIYGKDINSPEDALRRVLVVVEDCLTYRPDYNHRQTYCLPVSSPTPFADYPRFDHAVEGIEAK